MSSIRAAWLMLPFAIESTLRRWAAVAPSIDSGILLLGNFFSGEVVKLRVADGEIVARNTIGEQRSLSGLAQYPGPPAGP